MALSQLGAMSGSDGTPPFIACRALYCFTCWLSWWGMGTGLTETVNPQFMRSFTHRSCACNALFLIPCVHVSAHGNEYEHALEYEHEYEYDYEHETEVGTSVNTNSY